MSDADGFVVDCGWRKREELRRETGCVKIRLQRYVEKRGGQRSIMGNAFGCYVKELGRAYENMASPAGIDAGRGNKCGDGFGDCFGAACKKRRAFADGGDGAITRASENSANVVDFLAMNRGGDIGEPWIDVGYFDEAVKRDVE